MFRAFLISLAFFSLFAGISEAQESINFLQDVYRANVSETVASRNIPRPSEGFIIVSCVLQPSNMSANISYNIVDPTPTTGFPFAIDPTNGYLQPTEDLDYERYTMFEFTVQCVTTSNASLVDTAIVNIQILPINDGPPTFVTGSSLLVNINFATPPGTVLVSADEGVNALEHYSVVDNDNGPHGNIFYSISPDTHTRYFSFNSTDGSLTLFQCIDREVVLIREVVTACDIEPARTDCPNLEVSIVVTSTGGSQPIFSQFNFSVTLPEGSSVGTPIITANCTDVDQCVGIFGGIELIEQSPSFGIFIVDRLTGAISINQSLDYEMSNSYELTLRCFDTGDPPMEVFSTVEVIVTDINDNAPTVESNTNDVVLVNDISPVDTVIFSFFCSDLDFGQNSEITYSIVNASFLDLFSMNSVTGDITILKNLTFQSGEYFAKHVLVLECSDGGLSPLFTQTELHVSIYKNDNTPPSIDNIMIPNGLARVSEGRLVGAPVITITAVDTTSPSVTYSLQNESSAGTFVINQLSGIISVNGSLDRESVDTYFVRVVATEVRVAPGDPESSFVDLTIQIDDENDNTPICSDEPDNLLSTGTYSLEQITVLQCSDKDSGLNSEIRFTSSNLSLVNGGEFVLNGQTGELGFIGSISQTGVFVITVVVSDLGVPPASTEVLVRVVVMASAVSDPLLMYVIIIVPIISGLLLVLCLLFVLCCCCCCCRRRMEKKRKDLLSSNTVANENNSKLDAIVISQHPIPNENEEGSDSKSIDSKEYHLQFETTSFSSSMPTTPTATNEDSQKYVFSSSQEIVLGVTEEEIGLIIKNRDSTIPEIHVTEEPMDVGLRTPGADHSLDTLIVSRESTDSIESDEATTF